jgi:octaprenyl-diphosphate synthase
VKNGTECFSPIDEITAYAAHDLQKIEQILCGVVEEKSPLLTEVGGYVLSARGKRLRPLLLSLVARGMGHAGQDHLSVGAALELVHTATLVHDDVIDTADLRRGRPTVNARWGNDVAILIADYLYSRAFHLAIGVLGPRGLAAITEVTARMCEGELFQIEKAKCRLGREDYLHIVQHKTAYLFGACSGLGAAVAKRSDEDIKGLGEYGIGFGVAFQITDDILDLTSRDHQIGKSAGTDIETGKQTLPILMAVEQATHAEQEHFWANWLGERRPEFVHELLEKYRGVDLARDEARRYADNAKEALTAMSPCREKELLSSLCDYVVDRTT